MTDTAPHGFRPIPSCPGYAASRYGEIYSKRVARRLIGSFDRYGYRNVNLSVGDKAVRRKVHRLVCEAFYGPPPTDKHQAAHLDGRRSNNNLDNLAWVTPGENEQHKIAHGTYGRRRRGVGAGATHPNAKLTDEQVAELRRDIAAGKSTRAVARALGINQSRVVRIKNGESYAESASPNPRRIA